MSLQLQFIQELEKLLGTDNVLTDPAECWIYGYDNSRRQGKAEAVVFANTTQQVQMVVQLCNRYRIPVTARGRGTGTPGGAVPIAGGIVLSLERMNKIISIEPANRLMVVEPGVTNQAVQDAAAGYGFFWPPDPSSAAFCTVGGNLAYNSAGPRAVKYGTARENTLGLQVITGAGDLMRTGTFTTKGVVGYDLTRLLIGSEGTLAITTQAILKLTPLPEAKYTFQALYQDIESATQAVAALMAQPVVPSSLELMDEHALALLRQQGLALAETAKAMLIIEIDGLASTLPAAAERIIEAATNSGLIALKQAHTMEQSKQLWTARKALSPALRTLAAGKINEDVVVPVANIPQLFYGLRQLAEFYHLPIVNFGHAGNGNIHVNLLLDPHNVGQQERAQKCLSAVFDLVLQLKGSLSGEHGVGLEKKPFVARELDSTNQAIMQGIKKVLDPHGILNPEKLLPNPSSGLSSLNIKELG